VGRILGSGMGFYIIASPRLQAGDDPEDDQNRRPELL